MANAYTYVTRTSAAGPVTTVTLTNSTIAIPVGSLVVLHLAKDATAAPSSVVDSAGNTYSLAAASTTSKYVAIWYCVIGTAIPATTGTWTATFASTTNAYLDARWNGAPASGTPLAAGQTAVGAATGTATSTASVNPGFVDSLVTEFTVGAGTGIFTAGSGFANDASATVVGTSNIVSGGKILAAASAQAGGGTWTSSQAWQQVEAIFALKAPVVVTHLGTANFGASVTGSIVFTTTVAAPAGSYVVVPIAWNDIATGGDTSMTDSRGNTYTRDNTVASGSGLAVSIWKSLITTALQVGDTITANWAATAGGRFIDAMFCPDGASLGAPNGQTTGSSTTPTAPAAVAAPGTANSFSVFICMNGTTPKTATPQAGWVEDTDITIPTFFGVETQHFINVGGASYRGSSTLSATQPWSAAMRSYNVTPPAAVSAGPTLITGTDSGTETETGTVATSTPGTDSATPVETGVVAASLPSSDTATVTETSSIVVILSGTDAASVTQSNGTVAATLAGTDSSTAADASTGTGLVGQDTGAVADSGSLAATLSGSDTGTSVQASTTAVSLPGSDSATETETGAVVATISATDSGTVTETSQVGLTGSDSGTSVQAGTVAASLSGSDTAAETETGSNGRTGADTATSTETGAIAATLSGSDLGTVTESGAVGTIPIVSSDTGLVVETSAIVATLSASDSGTVAETWAISAAVTGADTATETDSPGSVSTGSSPTGTDSVTVTESSSIVVILSGSDAGTTGEIGALAAALSGADSGVSVQGWFVSGVTLVAADSGTVTESGQVAATLAGADSGTGTSSHLIGLSSTDVAHAGEGSLINLNLANSDQVVFNETGFIVAVLSDGDSFSVTENFLLGTGSGVAMLYPINLGFAILTAVSRGSVAPLAPVSRSAATITPVLEPIAELEPT